MKPMFKGFGLMPIALFLIFVGPSMADLGRESGIARTGASSSVRGTALLAEIVHRHLLQFEDSELDIATETTLSGVSLSGKTARIILTDALVLSSFLDGGLLDLPGIGVLPEVPHPSTNGAQAPPSVPRGRPAQTGAAMPHRFFGYPDEIIAVITPSGGLIVKLLRPARTQDECLEAAIAMAPAVAGGLPSMNTAPSAGIRLRIASAEIFLRDSFLLTVLFEDPPLPAPFEGFDRIWIGLNQEESEARLTRLESPYARLIIKTGPVRARDRAFFTRMPNNIDLQRIDPERRLNLLIESDHGLAVSEAEASAWIDRLTVQGTAARP